MEALGTAPGFAPAICSGESPRARPSLMTAIIDAASASVQSGPRLEPDRTASASRWAMRAS